MVVSLFVNPAQFGAGEDLDAYPRDEERDAELAEAEGVDVLFAPPPEEVYPDGLRHHACEVEGLTEVLCGDPARRGREHFDGVTTVVTKLLNMVRPGRRLLRPEGRPAGAGDPPAGARPRHPGADRGRAHRARAGRAGAELAQRLPEPAERERALALSRALDAADAAVAAGQRDAAAVLAAARAELRRARASSPSTWSCAPPTDLSPVERVNGSTLLAVAARVGRARLIDNTVLGGTQ